MVTNKCAGANSGCKIFRQWLVVENAHENTQETHRYFPVKSRFQDLLKVAIGEINVLHEKGHFRVNITVNEILVTQTKCKVYSAQGFEYSRIL